jgi:hypothetical protein
MIALLHYAFLKGMRDRSLPIFLLMMPAQVAAMLIGFSVIKRHLQYPLLGMEWGHGDVVIFSIILPSFVATLSAFWTFRSEVATRAIGSFVIASRPITVVVALIIFAAATATGGSIATTVTIAMLTAALPPEVASFASLGIIASLAGASLGALYVTISPQPAMLVWAFIAGLPLAPWILHPPSEPQLLMIASLLSIVCIGVSAFLLRRRCAT